MSSIVNGLVVPGRYFPLAYALIVGTGLVMALVIGMRLHFSEIVKTHCKTAEYWPSISATTGDFAPERFIWRTAFVVCALFRFTTGFLTFKFFAQQEALSAAARAAGRLVTTRGLVYAALVGELLRCASAMGWTVISSGEDNLHHNASFAVYMVVGFVLQASQVVIVGRLRGSYGSSATSLTVKKACLLGQTVCALSVGFFYVRHHQTCAPGAYSRSTMCEWMFALFNILFDASQAYELQNERVSFGAGAGEPVTLNLATVPSSGVLWVSDVFFAYLTVASIIQLIQAVYFVPMVAMEFTWEVSLLFGVAAPVLLYVPRIRRFVQERTFFGAHGYVLLYCLSVLSLFSFDFRTSSPGTKITVTSIGAIALLPGTFARQLHAVGVDFTDSDRVNVNYSLPLGLAVSMMLRMMFASLDPLYVSAMYNGFVGLVFGSWCAWIQYRRSAYAVSAVVGDAEEGKPTTAQPAPAPSSQALLGVAFGSCISLSLVMVSSPGFIARLVGIEPWPSSIVVIGVFLLGLYLSPTLVPPRLPSNRGGSGLVAALLSAPIVVALFVCGFLVLLLGTRQSNRTFEKPHAHYPITYETVRENVKLSDWTVEDDFRGSPVLAFVGGLAIVLAIGATWPALLDVSFNALRSRSAVSVPTVRWYKSFEFVAGVVIVISFLAQVYVVCFPFVPLGFLLRDRLDVTLIIGIVGTVCPLLMATRSLQLSHAAADASPSVAIRGRQPPTTVLCIVLLLLGSCVMGRMIGAPDSRSVPLHVQTLQHKLTDVLSVAQELRDFELHLNKLEEPRLSDTFRQYSVTSIEEKRDAFKRVVEQKMGADVLYAAEQTSPFSAMIWTIHFGYDNYNTDSFSRMVDMIRDTKAGVIGLLESDAMRIQTGNRDVVEYIAMSLGYDYTDYGPTTFDGTFGCALITKYPILYSRRYVLPSPLGELACLIHAKLDLFGVETNVYVGHWGNTQHWADGVLQSEFLGDLVQRNPGPSVFLGYLVTKPQEGNYNYYASATEPGKFRDTALQLYKQRSWRRLTNLGGYVEQVSAEDQQLSEVDQQYHRPPEGADARYFYFDDTQRYSTAHPRWEYVDRYCQYILYKTGLPQDERPEYARQLQPYHFELIDWWRVLDIHELSDTEIQVVQLALVAGSNVADKQNR